MLRVLDKRLGISRLTQIGWHVDHFAVCLACNLRHHCFERLLAMRADRHIDTLASQGKGDRLTNPCASAGDECVFPFIWRSIKLPSG